MRNHNTLDKQLFVVTAVRLGLCAVATFLQECYSDFGVYNLTENWLFQALRNRRCCSCLFKQS